MRLRISRLRQTFAATALLSCGLVSVADAQVEIIPGNTNGGYSNGLPIGEPEATGGVYGESQQRYDSPLPWMHGYWQEIPAYGGFGSFRPYNYKHVFSQSQAAGGWGMSPTMPYSQQFWHRYRQRASMRPQTPGTAPGMTPTGYPSSYRTRYPAQYGQRQSSPPTYPRTSPPVNSRRYLPPTTSGPQFGFPPQ